MVWKEVSVSTHKDHNRRLNRLVISLYTLCPFVFVLAWSLLYLNESVTGIHALVAEPLEEGGPLRVAIRHSESRKWIDLQMNGCRVLGGPQNLGNRESKRRSTVRIRVVLCCLDPEGQFKANFDIIFRHSAAVITFSITGPLN